jgi:secreted trypsin-like serine protease
MSAPSQHGRSWAALFALAGLFTLLPASSAHGIVGGTPAPPDRWPWMAAILDSSNRDAAWAQYCGGVVIAPRRVLTAAHCLVGRRARDVDVLIGRTRLTEPGGRRLDVSAISVFPGYARDRRYTPDVAVATVTSDTGVTPVALAAPGDEAAWLPGASAWTMGWGVLNARRSRGGDRYYADRLRELELPVVSDDACESVFGIGWPDAAYVPSKLVCAGTADGTTGVCSGDSGGPLVVGTAAGWLDVGIVAGGDACASRGYYDVFTRVDRVRAFALGALAAVQPDPVRRPRIVGRLAVGARVRCTRGAWRGTPARLTVRWTRPAAGRRRIVGRHWSYTVRAADARHGLRCTVTATNRGGRNTATTRRRPDPGSS